MSGRDVDIGYLMAEMNDTTALRYGTLGCRSAQRFTRSMKESAARLGRWVGGRVGEAVVSHVAQTGPSLLMER